MKLSLRSKQEFYRQFGQLLKAGVAVPKALETLERSGTPARLVGPLRTAISNGNTIAEAFAGQPLITPMEASVCDACERSGRLDHACVYLSNYFQKLKELRSELLRKLAYPLFLLHFGILIMPVNEILTRGIEVYLRSTLGLLVQLYVVAGAIWVLALSLKNAGATVAPLDRALRAIPVLGPLRRAFAIARFSSTYDMQLDAGVNIVESLRSAARASQSGSISEAIERILPEVRAGNQVGPLLASSGAFPTGMTRAFCIAEETGGLDEELKRLSAEFEQEIHKRLETLANWAPKLIYVAITLFLAYRIVSSALGMAGEIKGALGL